MRSTNMGDASALLALAKHDVEKKAQTVDPKAAPESNPPLKGNSDTLEGPQSLQMYGNREENVMNKKEDDHSDIKNLQGQPLDPSDQEDTIGSHSDTDRHSSKDSEKSKKEAQSPISRVIIQKEEPKEVDCRMIPHKRHTPKNMVERVEQLEKQLDEMASTKSPSRRGTERHRKQETLMLHTGRYQSSRNLSSSAKLKSELRKFCTLPMPMDELYPRLLEKRLIPPVFLKQSPHLLHDSSKQCEFHFGRPGHSLEDCHALKCKVQDLVDHGILIINGGSTPNLVHLTMLPTLSKAGEHIVPKNRPKLTSKFRNPDDQCSSDKEKAEYPTNRCMTLKRKIQELSHLEPEVPVMVQAGKPNMHIVLTKKVKSTLGSRANEPSKD
uniref:Uncharacterized protein n=1 Tax=Fagus sylvatica TaxID=28930 RepID=A0A2N9HAU6_FAGSY